MILNAIRNGLGQLIVVADSLTRPRPVSREAEEQKRIEAELSVLAIYQYHACPFCVKTRRAMHRMNLPIELRDAKNNQTYRQELESEGGKIQVPSMKITEKNGSSRWLYESDNIIEYLETLYG